MTTDLAAERRRRERRAYLDALAASAPPVMDPEVKTRIATMLGLSAGNTADLGQAAAA